MTAQKGRVKFETSVNWSGGDVARLSSEGLPDIQVSAPPQFNGPEGNWSPEELQVAALETCILLTFLYHAGRADVEVADYSSKAEGTVEMGADGMAFSEFAVEVQITLAPDADAGAAEQAIKKATGSCLVHRSLRSEVNVKAHIRHRSEQ